MVETSWALLTLISEIWVIYDLFTYNRSMSALTKLIWIIVVLVLGIIGVVLYYFLGRKR
ncbi:PLDc N-terminal domain-containing protein [Methanolobus zinderi]|uniref:PLDc N-terminal domain-containing protein n=1 Tax=Methanolobus zinderi TaxID=536044 RepID=A0A7D5E7Y6_9EURY|nr:PLDc N-terminal domain-containing protein [Methanolobus zinderi]